jgi:hypothetical protein
VKTRIEAAKLAHVSEFALSSEAFTHGSEIPRRHTCEGEDVSPALSWSDPPSETRTLALIVDDPDAPIGTFTHWLAWNIDPSAGGLGEGESPTAEGSNDFGAGGWSGPCPPRAHGRHFSMPSRLFTGQPRREGTVRASAGITPISASKQERVLDMVGGARSAVARRGLRPVELSVGG